MLFRFNYDPPSTDVVFEVNVGGPIVEAGIPDSDIQDLGEKIASSDIFNNVQFPASPILTGAYASREIVLS